MDTKKSELDMLIVDIHDKEQLYVSYMPFIKNGGLFIATDKVYPLAEELLILLHLFGEKEKFPIKAKVVWITPRFSQGRRSAGIGVQFLSENAAEVCRAIDAQLAGYNANGKLTQTL